MFPFVESICIIDGQPQLLDRHQKRLEITFEHHYSDCVSLDIESLLPKNHERGKLKGRFLYNETSFRWECADYQLRPIDSLRVMEISDIDYSFKRTDRRELTALFEQRKEADDIIIVKNGLVTDSYSANLVFFDGRDWYTPSQPLLKGVKRDYLLEKGTIKVTEISKEDLVNFEKVSLINAMIELGEVEIPMSRVKF